MLSLDEELPADTLYESDGGQVLPATALHDRFYRRYGRLPTDVESYILHARQQYEKQMGRSPTAEELGLLFRRAHESREDMPV